VREVEQDRIDRCGISAVSIADSISVRLRQPSRAQRSRAKASISGLNSMPTTRPVSPTPDCSSGKLSPVPQATSSTVWPGCNASRATVRRRSPMVRAAVASYPAACAR